MRIGLILTEKSSWTGGFSYQSNLLEALRQYAPQVEVYLLTHHSNEVSYPTGIKCPIPPRGKIVTLINRAIRRLSGYDLLLWRALRMIPGGGVDLTFPGQFLAGRQTATLYWIADFQHIHLPEMFTAAEIRTRDAGFRRGIRRATLVVLSSQDARKDFCNFVPQYAHKARVMSFVAHVSMGIYDKDPRTVVVHYKLPERFFYLPNQFWKHKNHTIVIEALKLLRNRGIRPFVVFTGASSDYRHPQYFAKLMEKISLWGLSDQVISLGLVPHKSVYMLIRQSLCVLNPSLFEGWSTTVEETKSVGKRILLSNLAVHREQSPPSATYFDPHNAEDLASKLADIWDSAPSGPDPELEQLARCQLPKRLQDYAYTFVSTAREAIDIVRQHGNSSGAGAK